MKKQKKTFRVKNTFGVKAPKELTVEGFAEADPFVPEADPGYVFRRENLRVILAWLRSDRKDGLMITGPTGCGKSSLVLQVASRLNLPVQVAVGNPRMEKSDLVGAYTLLDGMTLFNDGPLTTAMRRGDLFLLEEWDLIDPAVMTSLNLVMEGRPLVIEENGGEIVTPAPGFGVVLTGNTAGAGDVTGTYLGTMRQNASALDRCWVMSVEYPDKWVEQKVLDGLGLGLGKDVIGKMIDIANDIRKQHVGEGESEVIEVTMSTRTLVRWAYLAAMFRDADAPMQYAMDLALTNRADPATREAVHKLINVHFGDIA